MITGSGISIHKTKDMIILNILIKLCVTFRKFKRERKIFIKNLETPSGLYPDPKIKKNVII